MVVEPAAALTRTRTSCSVPLARLSITAGEVLSELSVQVSEPLSLY